MGCWQKESEFGKTAGCFKASLDSLGKMSLSNSSKVFSLLPTLADGSVELTPSFIEAPNMSRLRNRSDIKVKTYWALQKGFSKLHVSMHSFEIQQSKIGPCGAQNYFCF